MTEAPTDLESLSEAFAALERSWRRVDAIVDRALALTMELSRSPQFEDFAPLFKGHSLSDAERVRAMSYLNMLVHDDRY